MVVEIFVETPEEGACVLWLFTDSLDEDSMVLVLDLLESSELRPDVADFVELSWLFTPDEDPVEVGLLL